MKIIVTGGAGFIGSHLVDSLLIRGDDVYVVDNLSTGSLQNIAHCQTQTGFHFIQCDIRDRDKIGKIFSDIMPDTVFHLAAQINVRESIKDPVYDLEVNVLGTLSILEAMRMAGCSRIIFSSTGGAMFGSDCPPYDEIQEACPETPYGISKRTIELLLGFYTRQYGMKPTILRYANVYGSRQNAQGEAGVISIFLDKISRNETPTIYGDGNQTRDFISVEDIISANLHVLDQKLTDIYHVGTGIETSVNQLWAIIKSLTQTTLVPTNTHTLGEIQRTALNSNKLQSTGWKLSCTIEQGLKQLLQIN